MKRQQKSSNQRKHTSRHKAQAKKLVGQDRLYKDSEGMWMPYQTAHNLMWGVSEIFSGRMTPKEASEVVGSTVLVNIGAATRICSDCLQMAAYKFRAEAEVS